MNKINYNQASEFCQKMATKYSELAKLNDDLDFLSKELDNKKESLELLQQRFLTLQEENNLNKQLLSSKSIYCKEVEAELEMILEPRIIISLSISLILSAISLSICF